MTKPVTQGQTQGVLPSARHLLQMGSRPAQVIAHPTWSAARDTVLTLATAGPRLIAVLGPPGSGKTTLLRDLVSAFGARGHAACLLAFGDSPLAVGAAGVVLVDEAERMSATRLEELCRGDSVCVIAVLPAFAARLRHHYPDAAIVRLAALSPEEAFAFLAERLAQLGLPLTCLTEAAWAQLIKHSRGVPRLLIALLWLTLLVAAEKHADCVTGTHVALAVEVRDGTAEGTNVEPAPVEPDFAEPVGIGEGLGSATSAGAEANRADAMCRRRWRGPAAGVALATASLVAATVLLTPGQMDETAPSGLKASPIAVGTNQPPVAAVKTEQASDVAPVDTAAKPPASEAVAAVQNAVGAAAVTPLGLRLPAPVAREPQTAAPPEPAPPPQQSPPNAATTPNWTSRGSLRVVLIYPRGDMAAAKRGFELARALRADGLNVDDPLPIAARKLKPRVMYYFSQDANAAAEMGRRLHGEYGEARLVTPRRHRPGTIEIAVGSD